MAQLPPHPPLMGPVHLWHRAPSRKSIFTLLSPSPRYTQQIPSFPGVKGKGGPESRGLHPRSQGGARGQKRGEGNGSPTPDAVPSGLSEDGPSIHPQDSSPTGQIEAWKGGHQGALPSEAGESYRVHTPYLAHGETETGEARGICPKAHSESVAKPGQESRPLDLSPALGLCS